QLTVQLDALRKLRQTTEPDMPYPIFPEPGGVIPWGVTDNGDVCYWKTGLADPNTWTVVVNESRGPDWEHFKGTMTEFLSAVVSRIHVCSIFPDDFPSGTPEFQAIE